MKKHDLIAAYQRRIAIAEKQFEQKKAGLFNTPLSSGQFTLRRTYMRELERTLSQMHEMRRRLAAPRLRAAQAASISTNRGLETPAQKRQVSL